MSDCLPASADKFLPPLFRRKGCDGNGHPCHPLQIQWANPPRAGRAPTIFFEVLERQPQQPSLTLELELVRIAAPRTLHLERNSVGLPITLGDVEHHPAQTGQLWKRLARNLYTCKSSTKDRRVQDALDGGRTLGCIHQKAKRFATSGNSVT